MKTRGFTLFLQSILICTVVGQEAFYHPEIHRSIAVFDVRVDKRTGANPSFGATRILSNPR